MKTFSLYTSTETNRLFWAFTLLAALIFLPSLAHAAPSLPDSSSFKVPGSSGNSSWTTNIGLILRLVVFLMLIVGLGLGLSDSIFALFRQINEARTGQTEWGPAIKTIGLILAGVVMALVIFGLANEYVFKPIDDYFQ